MIEARTEAPRRLPEPNPTIAVTSEDLFALGRAAAAAAGQVTGGRVVFARARQLLPTGAWRGPRDAADAYVEEEDLPTLGGLGTALAAGVRTIVASTSHELVERAHDMGLRCLWRIRYRAGEPESERLQRLESAGALVRAGVDGMLPAPEGEPLGLDTLRFVAQIRLETRVRHLVVDFAQLGHRLAQMCLGFGADELFG